MARPRLDKMKKRSRELAQQESQKLKREARAERSERKKSEIPECPVPENNDVEIPGPSGQA